jgi:hypothetical protein
MRSSQSIMIRVTCHNLPMWASGLTINTILMTRDDSICAQAGMPVTQPTPALQPTIYERLFWNEGGANSLTQWYCPPAVGALHL